MRKFLLGTIAAFCLAAPATAQPLNDGQLQAFLDTYFNSATKSENTVKYFCGGESGYLFNQPVSYKVLGYKNYGDRYMVRVQVVSRSTTKSLVGNVYNFSVMKNQGLCINGFYLLPNEFANP